MAGLNETDKSDAPRTFNRVGGTLCAIFAVIATATLVAPNVGQAGEVGDVLSGVAMGGSFATAVLWPLGARLLERRDP